MSVQKTGFRTLMGIYLQLSNNDNEDLYQKVICSYEQAGLVASKIGELSNAMFDELRRQQDPEDSQLVTAKQELMTSLQRYMIYTPSLTLTAIPSTPENPTVPQEGIQGRMTEIYQQKIFPEVASEIVDVYRPGEQKKMFP
jgi:serine/threonine protein kinase HipA of HipAB toxin-antitoxin module